MIEKFTVARDDAYYLAFPDVCRCANGDLLCVFTQTTHHGNRAGSRIVMTRSADRGRFWSPRTVFCGADDTTVDRGFYNCARVSRLSDGRLCVVADRIVGSENEQVYDVHLWFSADDGRTWDGPIVTGCAGIVPDKPLRRPDGRLLLAAHARGQSGFLEQYLWFSDDDGATFSNRVTVAAVEGLNLCEVSLLPLDGDTLVAFLRENSFRGCDCKKTVSRDGGLTWGPVTDFPLPGCHRPVSGFLNSGRILITHRFLQGGNGWLGSWTQNFFAALTDRDSVLAEDRGQCRTRILPVDFDRSPVSDIGYSGWVQFEDGEIFIVNYLVDDAPKAQIRGYSLHESDFILE